MKYVRFLMSLMFLVVFPSCWQKSTEEMQEKKSMYVINLLDDKLYTDCHIKGSVNVSLEQLKSFASALDKNTEIIVYCSNYMCGSSQLAYRQLTEMGFTNVWAYEGGIAEWYQLGYPVKGLCTQGYLKLVVEQHNDEQTDRSDSSIRVITAEQLRKKMYNAAA